MSVSGRGNDHENSLWSSRRGLGGGRRARVLRSRRASRVQPRSDGADNADAGGTGWDREAVFGAGRPGHIAAPFGSAVRIVALRYDDARGSSNHTGISRRFTRPRSLSTLPSVWWNARSRGGSRPSRSHLKSDRRGRGRRAPCSSADRRALVRALAPWWVARRARWPAQPSAAAPQPSTIKSRDTRLLGDWAIGGWAIWG